MPNDAERIAEVQAAAERYRTNAYADGHFGEADYRNVGYLTGAAGWEDRVILANAYIADQDATQELRDELTKANQALISWDAVHGQELRELPELRRRVEAAEKLIEDFSNRAEQFRALGRGVPDSYHSGKAAAYENAADALEAALPKPPEAAGEEK